jgi:hypothetical protein
VSQRDYFIEQATVELRIGFTDDQKPFSELTKCATGFYVRKDGITHLATNWHVVTGRHFITEEFLSEHGAPRYLVVKEWVTKREFSIPLYDANEKPIWNEHNKLTNFEGKNSRVDVATIPAVTSVNAIDIKSQIDPRYQQLEPHDAVIVLGYPFSRERAIWKTANIAESVQPYKDYYLINGRTKSGMSGSGVFSTFIRDLRGQILIGIYSGRIEDFGFMESLNDLDIGVVWKPTLLLDLLP